MTDYSPVNPKIYDSGEMQQAIEVLKYLHELCNLGDIIQDASPALLIAIDCISQIIVERENDPLAV